MSKNGKKKKNGNGKITIKTTTVPETGEAYLHQNQSLRIINENLGGTDKKPNAKLLRLIEATIQLRNQGHVKGIYTDLLRPSDRDVHLALTASKFGSHVLTASAFLLRSTPRLTAETIKKSLTRTPGDRGFAEAVEKTVRDAAFLLNRDRQLFNHFDFENMNWNDPEHKNFKNFEEQQNMLNQASGELIKDINETHRTNPAAVYLYLIEKIERLRHFDRLFQDEKYYNEQKAGLNEQEFLNRINQGFYREAFQHQYFLNQIYDALEMPEEMRHSNDIPFMQIGAYKLLKGGSESRKEFMPREHDITLKRNDYLQYYEKAVAEGEDEAIRIHRIMSQLFTTPDGKKHLRKFSPELARLSYDPYRLDRKGILSYAIKKYLEEKNQTNETGIHDIFRSRIIINNPEGVQKHSKDITKAIDSWLIEKTRGEYSIQRKHPEEFLQKHGKNLTENVSVILRDKRYADDLDIEDRFKTQDPKARGRSELKYVIGPTDPDSGKPQIEGRLHHRKDYLRVEMGDTPHVLMKTRLVGTSSLGITIENRGRLTPYIKILQQMNARHRKLIIDNPSQNGIDKYYGIRTGT